MKEFKTKPLIGLEELDDKKYSIQQLNRIENGKNTSIVIQASYESRQKGGLTNKETGHISELGKKWGAINVLKGGTTQEIRLMGAKAMAQKSSRIILQFDLDGTLIKEWNSMNDAKRAGYAISSISRCCNGKLKSTQGFIWKFK
jgi:hypothetical protein